MRWYTPRHDFTHAYGSNNEWMNEYKKLLIIIWWWCFGQFAFCGGWRRKKNKKLRVHFYFQPILKLASYNSTACAETQEKLLIQAALWPNANHLWHYALARITISLNLEGLTNRSIFLFLFWFSNTAWSNHLYFTHKWIKHSILIHQLQNHESYLFFSSHFDWTQVRRQRHDFGWY